MKTATTVFELSKILKISASTVSRALKNHPDIAPETRKRVLDLAKELDYVPNLQAVGLRTNKSREFAVVVPNLSGFFYHSFITALESAAGKVGYSLFILLSGDDPAMEEAHIKLCRQRKVAGVFACITPGTQNLLPFSRLLHVKIPVIFFDKVPIHDEFVKVCVADEQAAKIAASTLIQSNRKKILSIFGDMHLSISRRRHDTFVRTFEEGGSSDKLTIEMATNSDQARELAIRWLSDEEKPDAIFCMSDEILIGVMKAIQILGRSIPDEVGVIAISNGFFPKVYYPEITYVETSGEKLGQLAFDTMIGYLNGDHNTSEYTVESMLVAGGSL